MWFYEFLLNERMEKGKQLLKDTERSLKDISRSLGYKYSNNFCTSFKKRFGKSPVTWRNSNNIFSDRFTE